MPNDRDGAAYAYWHRAKDPLDCQAQKLLAEQRDDEVAAKHQFEREHRAAMLAPNRPRVERGGFTTAELAAWVDEQCAPAREGYEIAEVRRKAAEDHLRTLFQQGTLAAVLAKSVHQAYQTAGDHR